MFGRSWPRVPSHTSHTTSEVVTCPTSPLAPSIVVDRPRHQVWKALTDPDLVNQYFMGATVKTDWQVGHPITFSGTWKDKPFEDKGEILTSSRRRR